MSGADPASILARAGLWVAELRTRGQITDEAASQLNEILAASFGERLDQQDDPLLVVMLCGPTAVGKSTLINALAGAEISRPGFGAATQAAVLYVHQQDDPARLFAYSHALASRDQAATMLVRHARDELLHKVLVDTPDIDSVRLQHRELTARLVHAADLVLFVTSPEKYKVLRSARWVLEQRGQRAMGFVLNKWDRAALGVQSDRRAAIEHDFRDVLMREGFHDALVFRVSSLPDPDGTEAGGMEAGGIENDLSALRAWLEAGISQSTATLIRHRRLRSAWGRLAAGIEAALPTPLSSHPLLPSLTDRIARRGVLAEQGIVAEALLLETSGIEDGIRPVTPGLLGMWTRAWNRIASAAGSARAGIAALAVRAAPPDGGRQLDRGGDTAFGARHAAALSATAEQAAGDAAAQGLALGPVGPAWDTGFGQLERQLALLPLDIAMDLAAKANRVTARRMIGIACLYGMETLIMAVLLTALWRAGNDFVAGTYAPGSLFLTVLLLVSVLLILGQTLAGLFFPPLRQRLRRAASRLGRALVQDAVAKAQAALQDQAAAVDRLAQDGRTLLQDIDRAVMALAAGDDVNTSRLFADAAAAPALITADTVAVAPPDLEAAPLRRPVFD